jgi:hypothetical protein
MTELNTQLQQHSTRPTVLPTLGMLLLSLAFSLYGCMDQDPFDLAKRKIVGDYSLERWEDDRTFYLHDSGREYDKFSDLGPIGGTVVEIGWSDNYIVAKRKSHVGGAVDGWMVIDVRTKEVTGPFTLEAIRADNRFTKLALLPASEAWQNL